MMLRKSKGVFGTIVAGFVLIVGQASAGRAALSYNISLGAGVLRNDNFHLDPQTSVAVVAEGVEPAAALRQPVQETIFAITPGVILSWTEGRDRLQLNYDGAYSSFKGDEKRDSEWVHTIAANLNWRRWSPFFLEASENRSRVPRTQEREGEASVDQVDRNRLSVRTGLVSEIGSRSTFEFAYRGELETYSVYGAAAPVTEGTTTAATDDFDRVERHFGEALARHRWTPLWGSELRAAYGLVDRELAPDYTELGVSVAVDQRWSEHLALRYSLEWRRDYNDKPVDSVAATAGTATENTPAETPVDTVRSNLLLGAEIKGDLERGGSWNLAYRDGQEDQLDGDTLKTGRASAATSIRARLGSSLNLGGWHETRDYRISGREETAWGPTLGVRWLITPWSALDLVGSWTRTNIREEGLDEIEDRTSRAAVGFVVLLVRRVQVEAGYGYRKNDSSDALRSYTNNLVFALLTVHFNAIEAGRLPSSYLSRLIAGGTSSGGSAQVSASGGIADVVH